MQNGKGKTNITISGKFPLPIKWVVCNILGLQLCTLNKKKMLKI